MQIISESFSNANQCWSMLIKLNWYQYQSMKMIADRCWPLQVNSDQCRSNVLDPALIGIDRHWEAIRGIGQHWSTLGLWFLSGYSSTISYGLFCTGFVFSLRFQISDLWFSDFRHGQTYGLDLAWCTWILCNTHGHCAMNLHIAQSTWTLRNKHEYCTTHQNMPLFSLAQCPVALHNACKSKNADRQDWYIFCVLFV